MTETFHNKYVKTFSLWSVSSYVNAINTHNISRNIFRNRNVLFSGTNNCNMLTIVFVNKTKFIFLHHRSLNFLLSFNFVKVNLDYEIFINYKLYTINKKVESAIRFASILFTLQNYSVFIIIFHAQIIKPSHPYNWSELLICGPLAHQSLQILYLLRYLFGEKYYLGLKIFRTRILRPRCW